MTDRRVLRYTVSVDDQWHRIDHGDTEIVHVDSRSPDVVEFWATEAVVERRVDTGNADFVSATYSAYRPSRPRTWEYRAFATGQPVEGLYVGTVLVLGGALVWHLFRREVAS